MKHTIFGANTLVPASVIGFVFVGAFWIAGLSKDIQAMNLEMNRLRSDRDSLEAEIIAQLRSQGITMQQIQLQAARTETKIGVMVKLLERRFGEINSDN